MSCHGGAVESVLDEATAELMKIQHSPNTVTRKFTCAIVLLLRKSSVPNASVLRVPSVLRRASILKPVPAFETLAVCCTYAKSMAQGLLIVIEGKITDGAGETLATATAEMVDLSKM